jgi:hypothetical protein
MATEHDRRTADEGPAGETLPLTTRHRPLPPRAPDNFCFRLLIPAAFLFCAAILILIASGLGDPEAPVNRLVAKFAPAAIAILAASTLIIGFLAMTIDRRRTLRLQKQAPSQSTAAKQPTV